MFRMARGTALLAAILLCAGSGGLFPAGKSEERPAAAAPSPSPAPVQKNAPPELRLPPDLVYKGGAEGGGVVVFRHTTHVAYFDNDCLTCHPGVFKILHPDLHTSHDEMAAGKSCGACHDGKKAFGITDTDNCETCHSGGSGQKAPAAGGGGAVPAALGSAGSAAAPRAGPRDVALARNEGSPGPVTFRHSSHGGAAAKCSRCHPALFPMKVTGKPLDYEAMLQGATCGACHNGKEAFGVDDSDHCERCHQEEGKQP